MRNHVGLSAHQPSNARWRPVVRGVLLVALVFALAIPAGALAGHLVLSARGSPGSQLSSGAHPLSVGAASLLSTAAAHSQARATAQASLLPFLPGHGALTPAQVRAALPLLTVDPVGSSIGASALSGHPILGAHPFAGGAGNNLLSGTDCSMGSSITAVGGSNTTLVAGVNSLYLIFNGSTGSFCTTASPSPIFIHEGGAQALRSTDGGQTWSTSWLPQNKSWTQSTSATWQSMPFPDPAASPIGDPSVASDNNGNVLYATIYVHECFEFGNCSNAQFASGMTWGIAVSHSTNSGSSWAGTSQVSGSTPIQSLTFNATCQSQGFANGLYWDQRQEWPSIAINPVNKVAIVTWDVFNVSVSSTNCLVASNQVQFSISKDAGVTWSAPAYLAMSDWTPAASIGPGPTYPIDVVFGDLANFTNTPPTISMAETVSVNNGTTWTAPADIAHLGVHLLQTGMAPDAFAATNQTTIAVDNWTGSTYRGYQYVAWDDNGGGTQAGFPTVMVTAKAASGGSTWSAPAQAPPSGTSITYYEPHLAVTSDGTVWLTYYGISQTNGNYNLYVTFSTNGGTTWAPQQAVTTQVSQPANTLRSLGSIQGLAGSTAGAVGVWTDCRSSACISSFDEQQYSATLRDVNISSNAPITLQVTSGSTVSNLALPQVVAWPVGSSHTLTAPAWLPDAASGGNLVYLFNNYSGAITSSNRATTFAFSSVGAIVVNYNAVPAAWISGYFTPNVAGAALTIDSTSVPLSFINATTLFYNYSVASGVGSYFINASAPKYTPLLNSQLGVTAHKTSWLNISLPKSPGWIAGTVLPVNASLLLGTTAITVHPDGSFNQSAPWGSYAFTASSPGRIGVSTNLTISPGATNSQALRLYGGWISGSVKPVLPGLVVKVNGASWSTVNGNFNYTCGIAVIGCPAGFYNVTASEPGYNSTTFPHLSIAAGFVTFVNFTLTNKGSIEVKVLPTPASVIAAVKATQGANVQYLVYNSATGYFAANGLATGLWTVTASANGYKTNSTVVNVTAGPFVGSPTTITLTASGGGGCTSNCGGNNNSTGKTTSNSGLSTTDLLLIVAVIVLIGVVAAVLILRRKPPMPAAGGYQEPPSEPMYGEAPPAPTYGGAPPPPPPQ